MIATRRATCELFAAGPFSLAGLRIFFSTDSPPFPYQPRETSNIALSKYRGAGVLHDPVVNKGTAHPLWERERLGLRGLLPPRTLTMDDQISRAMERYWVGDSWLTAEDEAAGGITEEQVRRWHVLQDLQDRNEVLFYRVLVDNFTEMAPIIYTPTVGHVCTNYHKLYRQPRGMFFSALDRGEFATMAYNWPEDDVDAIVVTDGSRILGLGDLGANGLGIPIGKLDIYVAAAGFHPGRVLPCVIDVGTNNDALRKDRWYMGLNQPRLTGEEYYQVVDEFVDAVMTRWPKAVLQFEDFSNEHAAVLLARYRHHHCMFNDDIQGTAATAVAGLYGAMAVLGRPPAALADQSFVVMGAGSAGMGVVRMVAQGMVKHGLSPEEAASRFHVIDADGLVTSRRSNLDALVAPFARKDQESKEGERLVDVIRRTAPTCLIGLTGAGRLFCAESLRLMGQHNERPIIMPMSNPTSKMECTHEEAQQACGGRAIFACGSPQGTVQVAGRTCTPSQANNMYIFPGLALGAHLAQGRVVSDHMLMAASETLAAVLTPEELAQVQVYPDFGRIREISVRVAVEVMKAAAEEGHLANTSALRALSADGDAGLASFVRRQMYVPEYCSLVAPTQG